MLYDVYVNKFGDDPELFERMRKLIKKEVKPGREEDYGHFCRLYDPGNPQGVLWTRDKISCTFYCPACYRKLNRAITVPVRKQNTGLYQALQNYLAQKVEQIGIYVETNPTSNLVIGGTTSFQDSHLFALNHRGLKAEHGGHEVMVTVNADDPGVFNTTSENELAYIYHSLSSQGYGKESVLAWVDKVRQSGMDSSFVKEEKTPKQMLLEIREILDVLERRNILFIK